MKKEIAEEITQSQKEIISDITKETNT